MEQDKTISVILSGAKNPVSMGQGLSILKVDGKP
jgi:hypothetical protein